MCDLFCMLDVSKVALVILITASQYVMCCVFVCFYYERCSHCDVGWLQTVDGYYDSYVKRILDNTIEALMKDPARKFIWVEIAFFYKWWKQASDTQRQQFRYLLTKTRQIEFIIGGFVMNDEALATYGAIVDQMTLGNSFLIKGNVFCHDNLSCLVLLFPTNYNCYIFCFNNNY